jgi:hypothetical protein
MDVRSSLSFDAIEAGRPHVDYWRLEYLASSAFANRNFTELSDGEVRLTHPFTSHLAHSGALWQKACEPIARWLAQRFSRAVGVSAVLADDRMISVPQMIPPKLSDQGRRFDPLTPLPAFSGPPVAALRYGRKARSRTTRSPSCAGNAEKHWSADGLDSIRTTVLTRLIHQSDGRCNG